MRNGTKIGMTQFMTVTGFVDRRAILGMEARGTIKPTRNALGYREFSMEDVLAARKYRNALGAFRGLMKERA